MKFRLEDLTKHFGSVVGADSITLDIKDGEFVAFMGPSSCGKTTTLLMIAGIYKPPRGGIWFDEKLMNNLPPRDRNIDMVFQSYALYPHMTVFDNLTFPMKLKKTPTNVMNERAQKGGRHDGHRQPDGPQAGPTLGLPTTARGTRTRIGQGT